MVREQARSQYPAVPKLNSAKGGTPTDKDIIAQRRAGAVWQWQLILHHHSHQGASLLDFALLLFHCRCFIVMIIESHALCAMIPSRAHFKYT